MRLALSSRLVLACFFRASAVPLPDECSLPAFAGQALRDTPSATSFERAGAWFAGQANLKCAQAAFEEAVTLEPRSAQAHYDLGVIRARAKDPAGAAAEFRLALEYKPGMAVAHNFLGSALMDMGRPAAAEAEFREALKLDPKSVFALDHLAQRLASERRYAPAIRYWKQALAIQPDSPEISRAMEAAARREANRNTGLAAAQAEQARHDLAAGNTALAEKRLQAAIASDPELVAALADLAVIRANKGDNQGAEKLFREAVEDDPNYGQGHLTLGLILAKDQMFAEAEAETDQAVKLNPKDATALAAAGKVKVRLGKSVEGIALLRKAVALAPASPAVHLDLGMVLAENFDLAGALTETGEAVRFAPGSAVATSTAASAARRRYQEQENEKRESLRPTGITPTFAGGEKGWLRREDGCCEAARLILTSGWPRLLPVPAFERARHPTWDSARLCR